MNKEIERLEFFVSWPAIQGMKGKDADKAFVNYSERGIKPELNELQNPIRYKQLCRAKRWQGIQLQMWEDGILDGSMPYWVILGGLSLKEILPRNIVDFMKKEMFRGIDNEQIEECYQEILKHYEDFKLSATELE